MSTIRELNNRLLVLNEKAKHTSVEQAFMLAFDSTSSGEALIKMAALFDKAKEDITFAVFRRDGHTIAYLEALRRLQEELLGKAVANAANTRGPIISGEAVARLEGTDAHLSELIEYDTGRIDGAELSNAINDIMEDIGSWDISEYAQTTLLLQLSSIRSVIDATIIVTDDEIRRRIKAVVADFACEFLEYDKRHRSAFEKLTAWARPFTAGGRKTISFVSDVRGLLPPP